MDMSADELYIKYEKVFIPEIVKIQKDKLDDYSFIKTIEAGSCFAHILQGGNYYYLCLSKDDTIRVELRINEPLGFKRQKEEELYEMAEKFNKAYKVDKTKGYGHRKRKYERVVSTPVWDTGMLWVHRMYNKHLINTITGQHIDLSQHREEIFKATGLSNHTLNLILNTGIESKNWCYKGERLDGQSWDDYFKNKSSHYKTNDEYIRTCFTKDNIIIYFSNLRNTAMDLAVSPEFLRQALIQNEESIVGYKIIKLTPEEYDQKLYWKNQLHQTQP